MVTRGVAAAPVVAIAALAMAACYSPTLRDCTLSCADESECADGQVCGTDHLCAAPAIAGSCAALLASDGGVVDARAAPADAAHGHHDDAAAPPVDATSPTLVVLHLQIDGQGSVVVVGGGTCDSSSGMPPGNCLMNVLPGIPLQLDATPHAGSQFQNWSGGPCDGQGATCVVTPTMSVDIQAKFKN